MPSISLCCPNPACRLFASPVLSIVGLFLMTLPATAAEPSPIASETREFEILIDQARAGKSSITICDYEDGRCVAATSADVRVTVLLYTYVYQFNGSEEWHDGRLRGLNSKTVDGLSKLSLQAQVDTDRTVLLTADGKSRSTVSHSMTTNYWRQPAGEVIGKKIPVIDADTGKTLQLKFEDLGAKTLTLAGKRVACQHFKGTGDLTVELWFDANGRLVRQLGTEDGHKTEIRLSAVKPARVEKR